MGPGVADRGGLGNFPPWISITLLLLIALLIVLLVVNAKRKGWNPETGALKEPPNPLLFMVIVIPLILVAIVLYFAWLDRR